MNNTKSEGVEVKPHVLPTYFEGTFPAKNPGECNISVVGLNNGNCIKIYLQDLEEGERLARYLITAVNCHDALLEACKVILKRCYALDASDHALIVDAVSKAEMAAK